MNFFHVNEFHVVSASRVSIGLLFLVGEKIVPGARESNHACTSTNFCYLVKEFTACSSQVGFV